jgi:opacity protein-like surface antigen
MDVHGVMRLTPEVSFYATRNTKYLSPYVGLHTGLVTLNNVQVYAAPGDTAYGFSANTLQLGGTVGLSLPGNFYVDAGYRYRSFQALEWRLPKGTLPTGWPKSLNMSAVQFTAGIQFDVGGITGRKK